MRHLVVSNPGIPIGLASLWRMRPRWLAEPMIIKQLAANGFQKAMRRTIGLPRYCLLLAITRHLWVADVRVTD